MDPPGARTNSPHRLLLTDLESWTGSKHKAWPQLSSKGVAQIGFQNKNKTKKSLALMATESPN
jgi:hypothetical protein